MCSAKWNLSLSSQPGPKSRDLAPTTSVEYQRVGCHQSTRPLSLAPASVHPIVSTEVGPSTSPFSCRYGRREPRKLVMQALTQRQALRRHSSRVKAPSGDDAGVY